MAPQFLLPRWPAPPRVRATFTMRTGGVSLPPFDSLNLALHVGDDPAAVRENRRLTRDALALPAEPLWLQQVHGTTVLNGDNPASPDLPAQRADAAVTRSAGVVCCVLVADCLPVLLAAADGSVIAAAHAGWRGLADGVLENSVRAMDIAPNRLLAWLGPAIGPTRFEVGEEVRERFVLQDPSATAAFQPNDRGRWLADLASLARQRLQGLGVTRIVAAEQCTVCDPQKFFSYRRDGRCGRMAALLWLTDDAC